MTKNGDSMDGAILTACYGRKYRTSVAIKADFEAGKDFIFHKMYSRYNGKPCSIRDMKPGEQVKLRYGGVNGLTQAVMYRLT